jgi:2-oxoacid:acceptor oxidoreductase delta subunit (pyruvate/2-ketoisovalerate family)
MTKSLKEKKKAAKTIVFASEKEMPTLIMSIASQMHQKTGDWRNIRPEIDLDKCLKCGICWKFCPEPSIEIVDEWPVIDYDYCKGCGICAEECPAKCITMVEEVK